MKKSVLFLLAALGSCVVPSSPQGPHALTGANVGGKAAAPATYEDWVDSLPPLRSGGEPFHLESHGQVCFQTVQGGMELKLRAGFTVLADFLDLRRFREELRLHMDLSGLGEAGVPQELHLGLDILADGEALYLKPVIESEWLLAQLQAGGPGLEKMTFVLDTDLFEDLMNHYFTALEDAGMDLRAVLPEGVAPDEVLQAGFHPAAWARAYLGSSDILQFRVDSNEVHVQARLRPELLEVQGLTGQAGGELTDMEYMVSFDRFTGLPTSLHMTMSLSDGSSISIDMEFDQVLLGEDLFEAKEFTMPSEQRRHLFPLDPFVQMAISALESQQVEDLGDMAF